MNQHKIKILSYWNHNIHDWQSNYELHNYWPTIKSQAWNTSQFIGPLQSVFTQNTSSYSVDIEQYTDASSGFYLIFYGVARTILDDQGLGFLTEEQVKKINQGSMKLLIVFVHETFDTGISLRQWFWKFCGRLSDLGITRANSVAILTSTDIAYSPHQDWRCEFLYYPWFELEFQQALCLQKISIPQIDYKHKNKIFINLNLGIRPHRFLMVMYLLYHQIESRGYISWKNDHNKSWTEILRGFGFDNYDFSWIGQLSHFDQGLPGLLQYVSQVNVLNTMSLDNIDFNMSDGSAWIGARDFYRSAWVDLVSETHFELYGDVFLTEKSFKSVAYGLPFIFNAPRNHLKSMKKLGYQSFPELFDERYDTMPSTLEKIRFVGDQVISLCQSPARLDLLKTSPEIKEKIKFNRNLFWSKNHAEQLGELLWNFWNKSSA